MQGLTRALLQYRTIVLILFLVALAAGGFAFSELDIEAYPDPSPPMVEFITQNPAWSAEEMEQQVTIPVETVLNGTPKLTEIRSISIFGLSDVKLYFDFSSSYFTDRQEALNRLQSLTLPNNLQPQLSPESPVGEIYPLPAYRTQLFAQRAKGGAGLVRRPADQIRTRHHRRRHVWRYDAAVSGGDRSQPSSWPWASP